MNDIVNLRNVSKKYKKQKVFAIQNMNLNLTKGEIVGILGPNGAGKSTIIKTILGVIIPTEGQVNVFGKNPIHLNQKDKARIGVYLGGKSNLIFHLPVMDTLKLTKTIYKIPSDEFELRVKKYAEILRCSEILKQRVATLSLGQKLKAELLNLLIFQPELFILDEPTLGLDIEVKRIFREILRKLVEVEKISIIMSSHDVNDMEKICNRIIFLNKAKVLWEHTTEELSQNVEKYKLLITDKTIEPISQMTLLESSENASRYLVPVEEIEKIVLQPEISYRWCNATLEDTLYAYYR